MSKLQSVLGYIVAALSIVAMLGGAFTWISGLGEPLATATGLETAANWTGGEVVKTVDHGAYHTAIHRMVFDALVGEHKRGFVQVAWEPLEALPARIDEEVDVDADGQADFRVELNTVAQQATLTPISPIVLELQGVYEIRDTLAVRVRLENPRK
jgi:hypothetical protein